MKIESLRIAISSCKGFDAKALFEEVVGEEGALTPEILMRMATEDLSRKASREKCMEIISEYDTDGDLTLNFEEF